MASLKEQRNNKLYTPALILHGNGKLLDFDDIEKGISYRYAQCNTIALECCPFASEGCKSVCYATKGNHVFPSVINSRRKSFEESKRSDFAEAMIYTINVEKQTKRYINSIMLIRINESGDFYSLQHLKKWVKIWNYYEYHNGVHFVFYTKSFLFFLMLDEYEKAIIRRMMKAGKLSVNLSLDDTTSKKQWKAYHRMREEFIDVNTYYCTEHVDKVVHDTVCDCADCARCGTCNKAQGKVTVVKIHSASNADMEEYRKNTRRAV